MKVSTDALAYMRKNVGKSERSSKLLTGRRIPHVKFAVSTTAHGYLLRHLHHGSCTASIWTDGDGVIESVNVSLCGYDTRTTWEYIGEFLYYVTNKRIRFTRDRTKFPRGTYSRDGERPVSSKGELSNHPRYRTFPTARLSVDLDSGRTICREELLSAGMTFTFCAATGHILGTQVPVTTLYRANPVPPGDREVRKKLEAPERLGDASMWRSAFPEEWRVGCSGYDDLRDLYDEVIRGALPIEFAMARLHGRSRRPVGMRTAHTNVSLAEIHRLLKDETPAARAKRVEGEKP